MTVCWLSLKRLAVATGMTVAFVCCAQAAVDPVTVEVHYQSGIKYFKRGLYDKSIQEFEKTLSLDPANAEAKAYLDKVREFEKKDKLVEPPVNRDAELRELYARGRELYHKGDYENAKDVFNKILDIKRVDDFASYYREQCEIYITRKLAREKKAVDKAKVKEEALKEKKAKEEAAAQKRVDHQEMLAKRAAIKEEQRQPVKKPKAEAAPAPESEEAVTAPVTQKALTPAQIKKQERQSLAQEKRQAALDRRDAKIKERDEKIQAKAEREARARQEKSAAQTSKQVEKDQALAKKNAKKQTAQEVREDRQRNKDLFIKGVEQYSKKDYEGAIATFNELIEKEKRSGMVYTRTSQRLKDKAELRLKGVGEDKEI